VRLSIPGMALGIIMAASGAGCAPAAGPRGAPDDAGVRAAMSRFLTALNQLDTTTMNASFADDISAFVPTATAERVNGKAAVARIFEAFAATARARGDRLDIRPEGLSVEAVGDTGFASFTARDSSGGTLSRRTFIFHQRGGRWLIVHFHASNVPLPP
jgi:ketosteroid isomerase-like protein